MEQDKNEVVINKGKEFIEKAKTINNSIKSHLAPEYRRQYNIKRLFSCFSLFYVGGIVVSLFLVNLLGEYTLVYRISTNLSLIYSIVAWKFWHYAFWSFQGGVIHNLSNSIIYIGSIWGVLGKIFLQNFLILIWIALIAPISGILTWRKAVKHDKYLYIDNEKNNAWE